MTTTLKNTFAGGTNGTTLTFGSGGNTGGTSGNFLDNGVIGSGATLKFDNTHVFSGESMACKVGLGASAGTVYGYWGASLGSGKGQVWFRQKLYFASNPTTNVRVVTFWNTTSAGTMCGAIVVTTTGKLQFQNASGSAIFTTTASIPLNQAFRIEGYLISSTLTGQAKLDLFSTENGTTAAESNTSTAAQNTGNTIGSVGFGSSSSASGTSTVYWMGDLFASDTAPVTGTAAVTLKKATVSASGTVTNPSVTGTAAVKPRKLTVSASGAIKVSGTASVKPRKLTVSASGAIKVSGTVSVKFRKLTASSSGAVKDSGTAAVALKKISVAGSGTASGGSSDSGTAAVTLKKLTVKGAASVNTCVYDKTVALDAPVARWNFTDSVGSSSVLDESGNGKTGTVTAVTLGASSPALPSGMDGTASSWNGSATQDVEVTGYRPTLTQATWEFWLNRNNAAYGGTNPRVWGNGPGATGFDIFFNNGTNPSIRIGNGTSSYILFSGANIPSTPAWHHYVFVYDGSQLRFYLDGVLTGTPVSASGSIPPSVGSSDYMRFGGNFPWQTSEEFAGLLSRAALYDKALTQTQILAHYEAAVQNVTLFGQPNSPVDYGIGSDSQPYTLGNEFYVSQDTTLQGIWWYSAPGVTVLPASIRVYQSSTQTLIHSEIAVWSGAAGSGWVRAAFSSPPSLTASVRYKACVVSPDVPGGNWYSYTAHYWDTGAGSTGITNGILSAPNSANTYGSIGQSTFYSGTGGGFPNQMFNSNNYWVDPEVAVPVSGGSVTGTGAVTLKKITVSGAGKALVTGSGAANLKKMTVSASGTVSGGQVTGTAAVKLKKLKSSGSGKETVTGTAAAHLRKMTAIGSGKAMFAGRIAVKLKKPTVSGHGTASIPGTVSIVLPKIKIRASDGHAVSGASSLFIFSQL